MAIIFACPVCKTSYTVIDADAGKKSDCKRCGQRLQVPAPPRAKTILGEIVPPGAPKPEPLVISHWTKLAPMEPKPVTLETVNPTPEPAKAKAPAPAKARDPEPEPKSTPPDDRDPYHRSSARMPTDLVYLQQQCAQLQDQLRAAKETTIAAREHLIARFATEKDVERYSTMVDEVDRLEDDYRSLKDSDSDWRRSIDMARVRLDQVRRDLRQNDFFSSQAFTHLAAVVAAVCVLGITTFCLAVAPLAVALIVGFLLTAMGGAGVLLFVNYQKNSSRPRRMRLIEKESGLASKIDGCYRRLQSEEDRLERARVAWMKAEDACAELKTKVRPRVEFDKAVARYKDIKASFHAVREEYERAKQDGRFRFLAASWRTMRGIPFEQFVSEVLRSHGFATTLTRTVRDHGVDVVAVKNGNRIAIQCKGGYAKGGIGNNAVLKVVGGKHCYDCEHAVVVSNAFFTSAAKEAALKTSCILFDLDDIPKLIADGLPF
jgi:HJR/Mrr/RecB family endonuclease